QSLAILERLQEMNGECRFILPGVNPVKPVSNNTLLYALYRLGYHSRQTGHGLRTLASTIFNEARREDGSRMFDNDAIENHLAHGDRDPIRAAYNQAEYWPERVQMMQWYADHLDELREKTG